MGKRNIGIYIGVNSVGAVVVENKKIISSTKFDLSAVEDDAKIERLSEDIRLEALINRAVRDIAAEEKDIYVSLADKDFIYRSLEMPLMSKKEIESSLSYEIAKYIPFKIEELRWAYGSTTFAKEKKINLSFIAIKDSNIQKTQEIFNRLGFNVQVFESSALSLARVIKSKKDFSTVKNFAVLDFNEFEAYLTLFYYDLPVFNRYLAIPKKEGTVDFDKFIDSVRLSLQYFKREFNFYDLEKFVMISNTRAENMLSFLKEEAQIEIDAFSPEELTDSPNTAVENVKALGVAGRDYYPYKFKPVLTRKITQEAPDKVTAINAAPINIGLMLILLSVGLVAAIFLQAYFEQNISTAKFQLRQDEARVNVPEPLKGLTWPEREAKFKELEKKVTAIKKIETDYKKTALFFERIAKIIPNGFWLENVELENSEGRYKVTVKGNGFLDDANQERLALDNLLVQLKEDEAVKSLFTNIDLVSSQRVDIGKFKVTSFIIHMN